MKDYEGSKVDVCHFNLAFTRDIAGMTLSGRKESVIRRAGIVFTQFYSKGKLQFEVTRYFPFAKGDDTMSQMAVNEIYREALRSVMGSKHMSMKACRTSYNHSGKRLMIALRNNDYQSYGAREEHRVTLNFLKAVTTEFEKRGNPAIRAPETRTQFYVIKTRTINMFSEVVACPIARWYQEVLGTAPEGMLGIDRQKLAVLLSYLLKSSYGSAPLERQPLLWHKSVLGSDGFVKEVGLGLKKTIRERGFGWLDPRIFNWTTNNFAAGIADDFPFPSSLVQRTYEKRKRQRDVMTSVLQDMDHMIGRVQLLTVNTRRERLTRLFFLDWIAIRLLKQYFQDIWNGLYQSSYEFQGKIQERVRQDKEAEAEEEEWDEEDLSYSEEEERQPTNKQRRLTTRKSRKKIYKSFDLDDLPHLTYRSVKNELKEEPQAAALGKDYLTKEAIFDLLFLQHLVPESGLKQGWKSLSHLHGIKNLRQHMEPDDFNRIIETMRLLFDKYCLCIPAPSKDRWLASTGKSKDKPLWIGFRLDGEEDCHERHPMPRARNGSWSVERDISRHMLWDMTAEEATECDFEKVDDYIYVRSGGVIKPRKPGLAPTHPSGRKQARVLLQAVVVEKKRRREEMTQE